MRPSHRAANTMREVRFTRHYTRHAEGSVLVEFGHTKVICSASVESGVPGFLRGRGQGWITAEYGMLPRSTHTRMRREASQGKPAGRTLEIQRLIGRVLRSVVDKKRLGENTIIVDCDVIQADGGTRTAAITGGYVALVDALRQGQTAGLLAQDPLCGQLAAISVGIYKGTAVLDLDYAEDSAAETDMNIVMNAQGQFIEIQGTAEQQAFDDTQLAQLLALAKQGIVELIAAQTSSLAED